MAVQHSPEGWLQRLRTGPPHYQRKCGSVLIIDCSASLLPKKNSNRSEKLRQGDSNSVNVHNIVCSLINPTSFQTLYGKSSLGIFHMAVCYCELVDTLFTINKNNFTKLSNKSKGCFLHSSKVPCGSPTTTITAKSVSAIFSSHVRSTAVVTALSQPMHDLKSRWRQRKTDSLN